MQSGCKIAASILALITLGGSRHAEAQVAHLTLQSQPGDWVGQGQNYDLTYSLSEGSLSAQVRRILPSGEAAELLFVLGGGGALLFFGTDALGIPIRPGFYPNAQRADFAATGHPGLDVAFAGHGCNMVTGEFTISQVSFGQDNAIQSFAASFEQHCEGQPAALFGTFTYSVVPEPSMLELLGGSIALFGVLARHKRTPL